MSRVDTRRRILQWGIGLGLGVGLSAVRAEAPSQNPPTRADQPPSSTMPPPLEMHQGRILFDVFYGRMGLKVGEAEHRWHITANRYALEVRAKTTGLIALFGDFDYVQKSEGLHRQAHFVPERFEVHQLRKEPEHALFDWKAGQVRIYRNDGQVREAPLQEGDQDILSLWHQLARITRFPARFLVVSNKAAKPATLEKQANEMLELPPGSLAVQRFQARTDDGQLTLDLWLAQKPPFLPVRVRMQDERGDIFDQRARLIDWPIALTPDILKSPS
jgi:hypothetical protein